MAHVISIVRVDPEDRNSALIELVCHEGAGHRVEYKVTWEKTLQDSSAIYSPPLG